MNRSFVISDERGAVLRSAGPVGWVLLEELTLQSDDPADGMCVVVSSARLLAEATGIGRDAVTRALLRLRGLGLLTIENQRDGAGRFVASRYVFEPIGASVGSTSPKADRRTARVQPANGSTVNGKPGTGDPAPGAVNAERRRLQPRAVATRASSARDNQLSLLNPDPA